MENSSQEPDHGREQPVNGIRRQKVHRRHRKKTDKEKKECTQSRRKRARTKVACERCRKRRIRCTGENRPCETCTTRKVECRFASENVSAHDITGPAFPSSDETVVPQSSQTASLRSSRLTEDAGAEPEPNGVFIHQWSAQETPSGAGSLDDNCLTPDQRCLSVSDTLQGSQTSKLQSSPNSNPWSADEAQRSLELLDIASQCARTGWGDLQLQIQRSAIRSRSSYSDGQKEFIYACQQKDRWTMQDLVSRLSIPELLAPISRKGVEEQKTILQLSAGQPDVFGACLDRLEAWMWDLRGALDPKTCRMICRSASAELAREMYRKGIDIAHAIQNDALLWLEIVLHNPDPAPLLNWLRTQHYLRPPFGHDQISLLQVATRHDRSAAAMWLFRQTSDPVELRNCVIEAAGRQTVASVSILECAMRSLPRKEGLENEIVDAAEVFWIVLMGAYGVPAHKRSSAENIAIQKVNTIASHFQISFHDSLISQVRSNDLHRLASALYDYKAPSYSI